MAMVIDDEEFYEVSTEIHPGGSLAGNESSDASSTNSSANSLSSFAFSDASGGTGGFDSGCSRFSSRSFISISLLFDIPFNSNRLHRAKILAFPFSRVDFRARAARGLDQKFLPLPRAPVPAISHRSIARPLNRADPTDACRKIRLGRAGANPPPPV